MLIALYSSAPASGKSLVAKALVSQGFTLHKFAHTIKDMCAIIYNRLGYDGNWADEGSPAWRLIEGPDKEAPEPQLGVSPRRMMQTLGTEWGREYIRADIWLLLWRSHVVRLLATGQSVVVDDMRFVNEYDLVRALGGITWRVDRRLPWSRDQHQSEGALDTCDFHRTINNHGDIGFLWREVGRALADYKDHQ